jgi:hypothetical protein
MDKFDYSNPDTLFEQTMTSIGAGDKEEDKSLVGSLLGLAGGALAGGVIGKFVSANNAAQASANAIILRKAGKIEEADKLDKAIAAYAKDKGIDKFSDFTTGKALADSVAKEQLNTIRKWELGGGANLVTPEMIEKGKTTAAKGDSRATTWEGGQVVANQNKPVYNDDNGSSNADEAMAAAQASRRASAQRAADKLGQPLATGGRATGGLVGPRPSKTKTKPKGKRGLGSK